MLRVAQLVERLVVVQVVAGSNPVPHPIILGVSFMIEKLQNSIDESNGRATMVSPGPSKRIKPLYDLAEGMLFSVNNAIECEFQFLVDKVKPDGTPVTCYEDFPHGDNLVTPAKYELHEPPIVDDMVNRIYPVDIKALSTLVLHGAEIIYLIGTDYGNPFNHSRNHLNRIPEDEADQLSRFQSFPDDFFETDARDWRGRHTRMCNVCEFFSKELDVTIYNLSPLVEIPYTKRLCPIDGRSRKQ